MLLSRKLKSEAAGVCAALGHKMTHFKQYRTGDGRVVFVSICKECGMDVAVKPRPWPNEINIGGEAVATTCKFRTELNRDDFDHGY